MNTADCALAASSRLAVANAAAARNDCFGAICTILLPAFARRLGSVGLTQRCPDHFSGLVVRSVGAGRVGLGDGRKVDMPVGKQQIPSATVAAGESFAVDF